MAFCTACGASLPEGQRFCSRCGVPQGGAAPVAQAAGPAPSPAAPAPASGSAIESLVLGLVLRLVLSGISALVAFVVHAYVLADWHEGFNPEPFNPKLGWMDPYLNVTGNPFSSTVIWTAASAVFWSAVLGLVKNGFPGMFQNVLGGVAPGIQSAAREGRSGAGAMCLGAALAMIASRLIPSNPQATLGIGLLAMLTAARIGGWAIRGLEALLGGNALSNDRTLRDALRIAPLIPGGTPFGFGLAGLLRWGGFSPSAVGWFTVLALVAAAALLGSRFLRDPRAAAVLWGVGVLTALYYALSPQEARADDGGKEEVGGTWESWWRSPQRDPLLKQGVPVSVGAGLGPLMPPLKEPRDYHGRDNPWDPSVEQQRRMWERERVIWDPDTQSWRRPRKGEIPRPPDAPEEPPPFEKRNSREQISPACLPIYDALVKAEAEALALQDEVNLLAERERGARDWLNRQWAKLVILMGWQVGELAGGAAAGVKGAGKKVGAGAEGGGPGPVSRALRSARERVARLTQQVARLADLVNEVARETLVARTARQAAESARQQLTTLKGWIELANSKVRRLARLDARANELAGEASRARRTFENAAENFTAEQQRIQKLEASSAARKRALAAFEEYERAEAKRLKVLNEDLPALEARIKERRAELGAQLRRMEDEVVRLREAQRELPPGPRLDDVNRKLSDLERLRTTVFDEFTGTEPQRMAEQTQRLRSAAMEEIQRTKAAWEAAEQALGPADHLRRIEETLPQRRAALENLRVLKDQAEAEAIRARDEVKRCLDEARPLKSEVDMDQARLRDAEGQAETLQKTFDESTEQARRSEERVEQIRATQPRLEQDLERARRELEVAEQELADLEAGRSPGSAGEPPGTGGPSLPPGMHGGGEGPTEEPQSLGERWKPGWARSVEEGLQWFGGKVQGLVGGQSPEEMAEVLKSLRDQVNALKAELDAKSAQYDAAMQRMRELKPQLDKCQSDFQTLEDS